MSAPVARGQPLPAAPLAERPRRIACVGNMNNNNFALMRYLRDLGADAHLFLYENEIGHFLPEHDTWNLERWRPFIHQLDVGNNPRHLLWRWRRLGRHLAGFDHVLGSGMTPALFSRAGRQLDLFYPYSPGIEYYQAVWMTGMLNTAGWLKRMFYRYVRYHQARGIRQARNCANLDLGGETERAFRSLGRDFHRIGIPMVYSDEGAQESQWPEWLKALMESRARHRLVILSHSRQHWIRGQGYSDEEWRLATKHNDYLLRGFADYVRRRPAATSLLLLFEYGKDVAASRALVAELGIASRVRWVPRCSRREIMELLRQVDVCATEFMEEGIWGGTAWEGLACGRPVIQSVNFTPASYRAQAGHDLPPLLPAQSAAEIEQHLHRLHDTPGACARIGAAGGEWFQVNHGRRLAAKYLEIFNQDLRCP